MSPSGLRVLPVEYSMATMILVLAWWIFCQFYSVVLLQIDSFSFLTDALSMMINMVGSYHYVTMNHGVFRVILKNLFRIICSVFFFICKAADHIRHTKVSSLIIFGYRSRESISSVRLSCGLIFGIVFSSLIFYLVYVN
jgi:hypothetical protein